MSKAGGLDAICRTCAGRLPASVTACPFCSASIDSDPSSKMPVGRSVHDAAETWARGVFGAPRGFSDLITTIEVRDEVLERVLTEIVRRDVREQRIPCNRRQQSPPRIDPTSVEPFEISTAALRAQSEYVAPCAYCIGAGVCTCSHCAGGGRARCSNCGGSGKEVKYYKKSSRLVNCKVCRASGTVTCAGCGGSGSVTCSLCSGSGHQLAWLTYEQESRWTVSIAPQSPIVDAHPQLTEKRFLAPSELDAFSVVATEEASGPVTLQGYRGQDNPILRAALTSVDPRLERINRQQYHRLAVVRRDASFAMCGTGGTLVLSGKDLAGAKTALATRPIQRRLYAWGAIGVVAGIGTATVAGRLRGTSAYFAGTNPVISVLALLAVALAIPALGAVLRAVRPGFKLAAIKPFEKYLAIGSAAVFATMVVVGLVARPRMGEVAKALSAGNVVHARAVLTALQETNGSTPEVRDAEDAVMFAEAKALTGELRLKGLDEVAARKGKLAGEASAAARADRLAEIRKILEAKKPVPALAAIDRWFPETWKSDAEIAEERARAHEIAGSLCADDPCRLESANLAKAAAGKAERGQRATDARTVLLAGLATAEVEGEEPLVRLKRLRAVSAMGKKSVDIAGDDTELVDRAKKASAWADGERAKVALIGAELQTIEEVFEATASLDVRGPSFTLDGTRAFLVMDAQKKCRGVYLVGEKDGARPIRGKTWTADRFLSQAIGRAATVKKPTADATTTRWFEVSAQVTARWWGSDLIELRIGDAAP